MFGTYFCIYKGGLPNGLQVFWTDNERIDNWSLTMIIIEACYFRQKIATRKQENQAWNNCAKMGPLPFNMFVLQKKELQM